MPSEERDRQFERALQRHLRADAGDRTCPDAETVAAYHDGTLALEELTKWKEHIGGCKRCQGTLALLEESSPVALDDSERKGIEHRVTAFSATPMNRSAGFTEEDDFVEALSLHKEGIAAREATRALRPKAWRWVVPLGALAAGLIVFVAIRDNKARFSESAKTQMAENRAIPAPQIPPPQAAEDRSKYANENAIQKSKKELEAPPADALTDLQASSSAEQLSLPPAAAAHVPGKAPNSNLEEPASKAKADSAYLGAKGIEAAPTVSSRAVSAPPPASGRPPVTSAAAASTMEAKKESRDSAKQPQATGAVTETVERGETAAIARAPAAAPAAEIASQSQRSATGRLLMQVAKTNPHLILAPNGKQVWRVGAAGLIESSSDSGLNWQPQTSDATVDLTAGWAPSEKVCWVVGKAGIILLTTDGGKHWKSIASPLPEDLGRVRAADAKHAEVWNVGNSKSFATADGGMTWTPTENE